MPLCRIYFFTYRRNYLVPRAIESLLNQSFKDWICEVHNDCPEETFPQEYINSLNDSRFIIKNHKTNLGGTSSFNLAFAKCLEKYSSILEDDNWWEPTFLEEMITLMDQKPELDIAWCNMRIWEERQDNEWINTGRVTWPEKIDRVFAWPHSKQALGALHSIGAMIYRNINAPQYLIPGESLLDAVELIRERTFKHPIYLNSKILANYSITNITNRSKDSWKWTSCQMMQLSSLVESTHNKEETFKEILDFYRTQMPSPVAVFFLSNIYILKDRTLYKIFNISDWLIFAKWLVKNVFKLKNIKQYLTKQNGVYQFLLNNTNLRYKESKAANIKNENCYNG